MDIIRAIEQQQIKSDLPEFHVGDNVKVHYRITEGNRERIQVFQGDVIRRHGHGVTSVTRWARPPRSRRSLSAKPIFGIYDFKNPSSEWRRGSF